jgi:hypothetical protein
VEDPKKEWMDRNFPPVNIWIEWDGGLLAEEGTKREKNVLTCYRICYKRD